MKVKSDRSGKLEQKSQDQTLPEVLLAGESEIHSRWPILLMAAVSWVLSLPLFAPWGFWPAGYVVFVPWLLAIALSRRPGWVYLVSYLLGAGFYLMHFRWLSETTVEGYLAASLFYVGPLFVPVAWITRHLYRARGWCLAFAFPLAWTAQELAHSRGPLAFPWFLLGHSQYRCLSMIQIADLAGVYGLSLVLAAVNGLAADLLLQSFFRRRGRRKQEPPRALRLAGACTAGLVVLVFLYGQFRLRQDTQTEGPRVSVVQGDYRLYTYAVRDLPSEDQKRGAYLQMAHAAAGERPDLIVFPETPWAMSLNAGAMDPQLVMLSEKPRMERLRLTHDQQRRYAEWVVGQSRTARRELQELASDQQVWVVIGAASLERNPEPGYPPFFKANSAFVLSPQGGEPARYDKINLVLFGEYVPFRYSLYRLYRFLNDGPWNPWGQGGYEYSCTAGKSHAVFPLPFRSRPEHPSRFGVTICYEDVIPQVFRGFILDEAGRKRADFMLNISNDGWFGYGTQQAQHLVNCAFRAVENRVGIARAVNTGISGFIRPDGSMYELVQEPGRPLHAGGMDHRTAPVMTDSRVTFYSRCGDLLPGVWSLLAVGAMIDATRLGWRRWRESRPRKRGQRKGTR